MSAIATVAEIREWLADMPDDARVFVQSEGKAFPVVLMGASDLENGRFRKIILFGAASVIPGVRYG